MNLRLVPWQLGCRHFLRRNKDLRYYAPLLILLISSYACAERSNTQAVFSSGEQRVAMIELFTSEGCSSCPPADRWLSGLKTNPGLWQDFVPVAFHVDYWDYIGWPDRFAKTEYSDRQRQYAKTGGARAVYTPGVFRQGKDWQGWHREKLGEVDRPHVGELRVRLDSDGAAIDFESLDATLGQLNVHLVLLGMNRETRMRAGENKDRKLSHDFVALNVVSVPMKKSASDYSAIAKLPELPSEMQDFALAVWVSEVGAQRPIQSVGGYLPTG